MCSFCISPKSILIILGRLAIVAVGFAIISLLVYTAGIKLVPFTDPYDKAILAFFNPDEYAPGLDQFFRALTDYTNGLISVPLLSFMLAYGLYRAFRAPKGVLAVLLGVELLLTIVLFSKGYRKPFIAIPLAFTILSYALFRLIGGKKGFFVGLLAAESVVVTALVALGKIWPNKTYVGANVLLVIATIAAFGLMTYLFHTMDEDSMRRFARVFWLVLLSVYLTDFVATDRIKDAVKRPRPLNDANKPWNEQVRIIPDEVLRGANSFPSGHTSGTFSLLTPLFWYTRNRKVRTGLLGWSILQGFSRVYTAAHFPFCCLMGGVLGFSIGTLVFFALGGPSLRKPVETAQ